jgi:hypothetical protein
MKRATIAAMVAVVAVLAICCARRANAQQQPVCLYGVTATPADAARRRDAIRVMRTINTAQAQAFQTNQTYLNFRNLTDMGLSGRPAGFLTQLTVEGSTYAVLVRDTADPCRYTLFSDQEGVIYLGAPLP